jgi:hypothetical protein
MSARATMRVAHVVEPNGPLTLAERLVPEPGRGQVRIRVEACGICHSDAMTKEGQWPGITYPRVPGHEVIGVIDAVGPRRRRADGNQSNPSHHRTALRGRLVLGDVDRLARHADVQPPVRRAFDERGVSAGTGRRSL